MREWPGRVDCTPNSVPPPAYAQARAHMLREPIARKTQKRAAHTQKKTFRRATVVMLWVMEAFGCGCVWARNVARTELPGLSVCADEIWFHELDNIYE